MASRREGAGAVLLDDGRVLIVGGYFQGWLRTAELFDPLDGGTRSAGTMVGPGRNSHGVVKLLDGRVMVLGGQVNIGVRTTFVDFYNLDGGWSAGPTLPRAREAHATVRLNDGRVLAAGGLVALGDGGIAATNTCDIFRPDAGNWTTTGAM